MFVVALIFSFHAKVKKCSWHAGSKILFVQLLNILEAGCQYTFFTKRNQLFHTIALSQPATESMAWANQPRTSHGIDQPRRRAPNSWGQLWSNPGVTPNMGLFGTGKMFRMLYWPYESTEGMTWIYGLWIYKSWIYARAGLHRLRSSTLLYRLYQLQNKTK